MRTTLGCLLALALCAPSPALRAADKKEDKKKDAGKKKAALTPEEVLAQADQKAAAGDVDGALELVRDAEAAEGAPGGLTLRLAILRELKNELDVASDGYKAAADKLAGPAKGEALGRMSVLQELRATGEAASSADAAVAADAAGVWPTIALARARAREKKSDEALALAQKAVAAGAGAPASSALGAAQEARGDLPAAEAAYRAALAADANRLDAKVGLARVLRKTSRAGEAEPILREVLAVAPGAIEAYKESARTKMALGRPGDAMGDAATAAALAESDAESQTLVQQVTVASALNYLGANEVDRAIRELTALRDKNPALVEARVGLAKALLVKRQDDAAVAELQKAVELAPDNAEAYFQLGFVQHAAKRNAQAALAAYEKAVALEPGNIAYRTNLGAVLAELNQYDRAVTELTQVTNSPGYNSAAAWIYLGGAHLGAKKYKDAVAALDKAVAIAPDEVMGAAYIAWSYLGLKDAANFKKYGAKARALGYKDATFLERLAKVEAGEAIK